MLRTRDSMNINVTQSEKEQKITYLKQAFLGFFKAKESVEMQHLGRVICAILGLNVDEQTHVMNGIKSLEPIKNATNTIESFTYNISSLFA